MQELVDDLLKVFRVVATIGFIATGALMISFSWKLYKKFITEKIHKDFAKYRWFFLLIAIVISVAWIYMYYLIFRPSK